MRPFAARVIDPADANDASADGTGISDSGAIGLSGAGNASPTAGRASPLPAALTGHVSCAGRGRLGAARHCPPLWKEEA